MVQAPTVLAPAKAMTRAEAVEGVNAALAELAGATTVAESVASGIKNHPRPYYLKPEDKSYADGAEIFTKAAADEKMIEPFVYTFKYRPWDVALAFIRVTNTVFGVTPTALPPATNPFTGEPIYKSHNLEIPVGPYESVSIPYGTVAFAPWGSSEITYSHTKDAKLGIVGQISVECVRRLHPTVRGLCKLVEEDLKINSIYKGKAITDSFEPEFLDPYVATNRNEIIWTKDVAAGLEGSLINIIKYTTRARERGQKIHRSVLFKGEPGNGKSETINIIAQHCIENGWTYVLGAKDLQGALHQARMYAPAVIALEDFERLVDTADPNSLAELLEELDGTSSKGHEIMLVTTSNFVNDLNQRIRRRMAKEIEFGPFDSEACARYLQVRLRNIAHESLDYTRVAATMDGWGNSFISKVVEFASGIALEHDNPKLTTEDLLKASEAQKPDWEAYKSSLIRPEPNKLDDALRVLLAPMVKNVIMEREGEFQDTDEGQRLVFTK